MQICIIVVRMQLLSYLDQLQYEARKAGVDLDEACAKAGIASTTLQRWRKGEVTPRHATAQAVLAKIREMAAARVGQPKITDPPREAEPGQGCAA